MMRSWACVSWYVARNSLLAGWLFVFFFFFRGIALGRFCSLVLIRLSSGRSRAGRVVRGALAIALCSVFVDARSEGCEFVVGANCTRGFVLASGSAVPPGCRILNLVPR